MRRRWFSDLPVGVARHEYRDYQGAIAAGTGLLLLGTMLLGGAALGVLAGPGQAVDAAAPVSLGDVVAGKLPEGRGVRLTGTLTAAEPPVIPGDSKQTVLAGEWVITVVASVGGRAQSDRSPARKELRVFEWSEKAPSVHLTNGVHSVEVAAPLGALPLTRDRGPRSPKVIFERLDDRRRPVAVEADGLRFELPTDDFEAFTSRQIRARAERRVLALDTAVTVVGAPLRRGEAWILGTPTDGELRVLRGTPESIARGSLFGTAVMGLLGGLALAGAMWRLSYARDRRREFIVRSNA